MCPWRHAYTNVIRLYTKMNAELQPCHSPEVLRILPDSTWCKTTSIYQIYYLLVHNWTHITIMYSQMFQGHNCHLWLSSTINFQSHQLLSSIHCWISDTFPRWLPKARTDWSCREKRDFHNTQVSLSNLGEWKKTYWTKSHRCQTIYMAIVSGEDRKMVMKIGIQRTKKGKVNISVPIQSGKLAC